MIHPPEWPMGEPCPRQFHTAQERFAAIASAMAAASEGR
jgi:hypothetical protein